MFEFKFPDVGEGITEGELVSWKVKEGDAINEHDPLCEIETDKAVVEIPSPKAGIVLKLHHKPGDTVKVGEVLVTIGEAGEAAKSEAGKGEKQESVSVVGELPKEAEVLQRREERSERQEGKDILAMPAVRKLARELGIDIAAVRGTGTDGRITEDDVRAAAKKGADEEREAPAGIKVTRKYDMYGYIERVPLKGVRKVIAERMAQSSLIPHVTHMDEADVTRLAERRERENAGGKGIHLTFVPFVIRAVVAALKDHPYLNASLEGEEIVLKKYYNISIAVDAPDGLMVPVIKIADSKTVLQLAAEAGGLAKKAADRSLDLADMKGGTFTITNVGALGGTHATPLINPPEVAILATGRIADRPMARNGNMEIRKVMPLSLSFDHRVVDGAEAARFVNDVKHYLENPDLLFV